MHPTHSFPRLRPWRLLRPPLAMLLAAALVACGGQAASAAQISVSNVWARPMIVESGTMPAMPTMGGTMAVGAPGTMATSSVIAGSGMPGMAVDGVTDALYVTITNKGGTTDRLTGAQSAIATATELHQTVMQNGIAQMPPVQGVDIPAHGNVTFKPGGYHVMLIGLARTLKVGDTFPVTLTFEKSGTMTVTATVQEQ